MLQPSITLTTKAEADCNYNKTQLNVQIGWKIAKAWKIINQTFFY